MKKLISILICVICVFTGCNRSEEVANDIYNSLEKTRNEDREGSKIATVLSLEEAMTLERLDAINDSIASMAGAGRPVNVTTRSGNNIATIMFEADARGFWEGIKWGLTHGKGITGRISSAAISGVLMSVSYSLSALITTVVNTASPAQMPNNYNLLSAVATSWNNSHVQSQMWNYTGGHSTLYEPGTDVSLQMALTHNEVLKTMESDALLPSGPMYDLMSSDQIALFNSDKFKRYFNAVPNIVNQTDVFANYCSELPYYKENLVMNKFYEGLNMIPEDSNDRPVAVEALSKQYVRTVKGTGWLSDNTKMAMYASFYIAPLSLDYWSNL